MTVDLMSKIRVALEVFVPKGITRGLGRLSRVPIFCGGNEAGN